jgi:hypothetical protein
LPLPGQPRRAHLAGRRSAACQVTGRDGGRCPDPAEVKLADSLGDSGWACLPHAEDILVSVPAAFIASHDDRGIAVFLAGH